MRAVGPKTVDPPGTSVVTTLFGPIFAPVTDHDRAHQYCSCSDLNIAADDGVVVSIIREVGPSHRHTLAYQTIVPYDPVLVEHDAAGMRNMHAPTKDRGVSQFDPASHGTSLDELVGERQGLAHRNGPHAATETAESIGEQGLRSRVVPITAVRAPVLPHQVKELAERRDGRLAVGGVARGRSTESLRRFLGSAYLTSLVLIRA
ncbi:MAG: hypothetical protein U5Q16_04865 [Gammaproteobacteria bacterium]|nr:hypothetical protein [Gammaproteobacteria bacterium]